MSCETLMVVISAVTLLTTVTIKVDALLQRLTAAGLVQSTNSLNLSTTVFHCRPCRQSICSNMQAIHFSNLSFLLEVPRVSVEPRNQTFTTGNDVQISCSASGYPPPRLVWTHNGMFITASSRYRFPLTQTESIILLYINYTTRIFQRIE